MLTFKKALYLVAINYVILFCSSCLTPKSYIKYNLQINHVDACDGIDASEAVFIARREIVREGLKNNCNINKPKVFDQKNSWLIMFDSTVKDWSRGYFWHSIRVDKKTGVIIGSGVGPDL